MTAFADYAAYYDLFNRDKDYAGEAAFVGRLIRRYSRSTRSVLELGCGSGRHATELVRAGLAITGVDLSEAMVVLGQRASARLPVRSRGRLKIVRGDVTAYEATEVHDSAISLFHVVNYQTTHTALQGFFGSARRGIRKGGVFVFDYWYGPAVLSDRPAVRVKRLATASERVTRLAEPVLHPNRNVVDVNYTLIVEQVKSGRTKEFRETHSMRYLFLPEIDVLAQEAGFELLETGEWLTRQPLSDRTWLGYAVARAV